MNISKVLSLIGWIFKQINFNQHIGHVEVQLSIYFNHCIVSKSTTDLLKIPHLESHK